MHRFSCFLADAAERNKWTSWANASLFFKLPASRAQRFLTGVHQTLRDGPGALILSVPKWTARMRKEYLHDSIDTAKQEQTRADGCLSVHGLIWDARHTSKRRSPARPDLLDVLRFAGASRRTVEAMPAARSGRWPNGTDIVVKQDQCLHKSYRLTRHWKSRSVVAVTRAERPRQAVGPAILSAVAGSKSARIAVRAPAAEALAQARPAVMPMTGRWIKRCGDGPVSAENRTRRVPKS